MSEGPTRRWRLVLEYDGAGFAGWQLQPDAPTVQGAVEAALEGLLGHPARLYAAGRTDTGVHAAMQVAVFDSAARRDARAIRDGLNARLPASVACVAADEVAPDFDPRRHPHRKTYRYTWLCRASRSPLRAGRAWHVRQGLAVPPMAAAVGAVVGTHDFSSFRASGCTADHPVRTVREATVRAVGDEVWLEIHGTGFLRHMVRILAGSLHEIGRGRRPPEWLGEVLRARDRTRAGQTAPAEGLLLERIEYLDGPAPDFAPEE